MNRKRGDASQTLTLMISLGLLLILTIYILNLLTPFVWYQKLQNIANKYIYVVEKFGYLTDAEEKELYEELEKEGFNREDITLICPKQKLEYGTLFEFEICYNLKISYSIIKGEMQNETRIISLHIKKYGYSKL